MTRTLNIFGSVLALVCTLIFSRASFAAALISEVERIDAYGSSISRDYLTDLPRTFPLLKVYGPRYQERYSSLYEPLTTMEGKDRMTLLIFFLDNAMEADRPEILRSIQHEVIARLVTACPAALTEE